MSNSKLYLFCKLLALLPVLLLAFFLALVF